MKSLNQAVCLKRWQAFALLGLSGFAVGNGLAKTINALGF
jgi:hypothetical protein